MTSAQTDETEELATELPVDSDKDGEIESTSNQQVTPGDEWNLKDSVKDRLSSIVKGLCNICDDWVEHITRARESREAYQRDRDTFPAEDEFFFSADMQKVIMLPRLPGNKQCVFTRRIIAFHETFAPLVPDKKIRAAWKEEGKTLPPTKPIGMVWHE